MTTAAMVIESDAVLKQAVRELGLAELLKTELGDVEEGELEAVCVDWLRDHISCDAQTGQLVEISAQVPERLAKAKFAPARLARGVANSYERYLERQCTDRMRRSLEQLRLEFKAQEKLTEDSRETYIHLLQDPGLNDLAEAGEQEILTPLMQAARAGAGVDKNVAVQLLDEQRRVVEAQAAKDQYLLHRRLSLQLSETIAEHAIAEKMPMRFITVHD